MENNKVTEYVSVMVPVDRLLEVYGLLGNTAVSNGGTTPASSNRDVRSTDRPVESTDWPDELLKRMYRESSPAMKVVLDVLIEKAGETVRSEELIQALAKHHGQRADHHTLAGTFGGFGRRVLNRYGRNDWPIRSEWNDAAKEVWYRMSPEIASRIKA